MTPPPEKMSKLFAALGADESTFDARTKAAANDAKQRWPMFKAIAPEASEATPLLTDMEKGRWSQVAPIPADERAPALSRPGLSAKLFKGLNKIARQTAAEVLGSARRAGPRLADPEPPAWTAPVQPAVAAPAPVANAGLFAKPIAPPAPAFAFASAPPVPAARMQTQFQPQAQRQSPRHSSAPIPAADDSLAGIFQRLEGNKPKPMLFGGQPVAKEAGIMSRLGKR